MSEDPQTIIRYRVQRMGGGIWWPIRYDPYDTLLEAKKAMAEAAQCKHNWNPVRIVREKIEFEIVEEE